MVEGGMAAKENEGIVLAGVSQSEQGVLKPARYEFSQLSVRLTILFMGRPIDNIPVRNHK